MKQYNVTKGGLGEPQTIGCVNWKEYPYKPEVLFQMGYSDDCLLLRFEVLEAHLKAQYLNDNEAVWEDSCVEFFVQDPDGVHYYNFEINCIGTLLAAKRKGKNDAVHFDAEKMARIKRTSTLSREKIDLTESGSWGVSLEIPLDLIGQNATPKTLRANLYKCGDATSTPHFLSWSPIATEAPDFHRPEFFGELVLL
ncbi:MAG: carbohydrate-binding family 9-like protein [Rikenellaceae bacterium]